MIARPAPRNISADFTIAGAEGTRRTTPVGAEVVLEDVVIGKTPFRGTVARRDGEVTLVIRLRGHVDRRMVVRAECPITRRVKLVSVGPPATRPKGRDESVNPFAE